MLWHVVAIETCEKFPGRSCYKGGFQNPVVFKKKNTDVKFLDLLSGGWILTPKWWRVDNGDESHGIPIRKQITQQKEI